MSAAGATSTVLTVMPLMSSPRISRARSSASAGVRGQLHAAGLAAAADENLRLDDDRAADALGGGARLLGGGRDLAIEQRHAMAGEDLLGPILLELQSGLLGRRGHAGERVACLRGEGVDCTDRRMT